MGQIITKLNTHTITKTKALNNTQGLFLCLINNNTMSHTKTRTNTITMTKINTKSHTNTLSPGITNSPTVESPPWEFGPYVGIQCDIFATPTWEFVPSVGICLHPAWEFDLVLAVKEKKYE